MIESPTPKRPFTATSLFRSARLLSCALLLTACQTPRTVVINEPPSRSPVALASGDVVKVSFVGSPEFDHAQKVQADGRISLPMIGELNAVGKTPGELQEELARLYKSQLQNNNVVVTLENTAAQAYVAGAVVKPGKVVIDRPMTVFEAIMETGGFEPDFANPKKVVLLRNENGRQSSRVINLSPALKGKPYPPVYVKARDIIYVPQSWF